MREPECDRRAQTWPLSMEGCQGRATPQKSPSEEAQAASLRGCRSLHTSELLAAGAPGRDAQCGLRRSGCAVSPRPGNRASVSPAPGRPCPGASLALVGSTPAPEQQAQSPRTLGVHPRPSGSQARPRPRPVQTLLEPGGVLSWFGGDKTVSGVDVVTASFSILEDTSFGGRSLGLRSLVS